MSAACGAAKALARGTGSAAAGRWPLFPRRSPGSKERSAVPSVGAGVRGTEISWGSPRPARRPAPVESWIERAARPLPAVLHGRAAPCGRLSSSFLSPVPPAGSPGTTNAFRKGSTGPKPGQAALTPRSSGWRFGGAEGSAGPAKQWCFIPAALELGILSVLSQEKSTASWCQAQYAFVFSVPLAVFPEWA